MLMPNQGTVELIACRKNVTRIRKICKHSHLARHNNGSLRKQHKKELETFSFGAIIGILTRSLKLFKKAGRTRKRPKNLDILSHKHRSDWHTKSLNIFLYLLDFIVGYFSRKERLIKILSVCFIPRFIWSSLSNLIYWTSLAACRDSLPTIPIRCLVQFFCCFL